MNEWRRVEYPSGHCYMLNDRAVVKRYDGRWGVFSLVEPRYPMWTAMTLARAKALAEGMVAA